MFIVLGGLVLLNFIIFGYFFWQKDEGLLENQVQDKKDDSLEQSLSPNAPANMVSVLEEAGFSSPVEKGFLETGKLDKKTSQVISFFLPQGEPIRAVFSGEIKKVSLDKQPLAGDLPFQEIRLEREDGKFWSSYVLTGEVLVEEGDRVLAGDVLALAGEGGVSYRGGANLSLWLYDKNNQMVILSQEIFD